jgi:hypothetical protein
LTILTIIDLETQSYLFINHLWAIFNWVKNTRGKTYLMKHNSFVTCGITDSLDNDHEELGISDIDNIDTSSNTVITLDEIHGANRGLLIVLFFTNILYFILTML